MHNQTQMGDRFVGRSADNTTNSPIQPPTEVGVWGWAFGKHCKNVERKSKECKKKFLGKLFETLEGGLFSYTPLFDFGLVPVQKWLLSSRFTQKLISNTTILDEKISISTWFYHFTQRHLLQRIFFGMGGGGWRNMFS